MRLVGEVGQHDDDAYGAAQRRRSAAAARSSRRRAERELVGRDDRAVVESGPARTAAHVNCRPAGRRLVAELSQLFRWRSRSSGLGATAQKSRHTATDMEFLALVWTVGVR